MTERVLHHRRTHTLLLFERLLTLREGSSPFTLVLDSLEQSGRPLIAEYIRRAKATKTSVVFVAYETLKPPQGVDAFVKARRKDVTVLQKEISLAVGKSKKTLLIIDTLHPWAIDNTLSLPALLSSSITPNTSLLATYHFDIPLPLTTSSPYAPTALTLLNYLATTIFTTHSLSQVLARKRAAEKSLAEPMFGLAEEVEGVVIGLGSNDDRGIVLEMEHRRKSGRGVEEWYVLRTKISVSSSSATTAAGERFKERIMLLNDHPLYRVAEGVEGRAHQASEGEDGTTFSLGLTEKQRRDREGVVLPYFDAQKDGGGGGGRILYDMGVEDDFDEEEDEM